jgi:hypothetical protein
VATTIRQIETALTNATRAGNREAVVRLTQILEKAKAAGVPEGGMPWGETISRAIQNTPQSAYQYGADIIGAISDPVNTLSTIGDIGAGALREGARAVLPTSVFNAVDSVGNQEAGERATAVATAVGRHYKDRYGSMDGFRQAFAEDPVGVASDLSVPITGGSGIIAKAPGVIGKIGKVGQVAGRAMDLGNNAADLVKGAGIAARSGVGVWTGAGGDALREGFNAARVGGAKSGAFYDNMRGKVPVEDVVDQAKGGLDTIKENRANAYQANIASTKANKTRINFQPINDAFNKAIGSMVQDGMWTGDAASTAMANKVNKIIDTWEKSPSAHTPWGMDGLKKRLSALTKTLGPGVEGDVANANRIVTVVKQAVEDAIKSADPNYTKAMADYAEPSNLIRELESALSLNDKASIDTALRKLQSIMRNNVNTNYGRRTTLGRELEKAGADTLMPSLAGQALNSYEPRGMARAVASPAAAVSAIGTLMNPALWPSLPAVAAGAALSSPRLMGEAAGAAGKVAKGVDKVAANTPRAVKDAAMASTNRQVVRQAGVANRQKEGVIQIKGVWYDAKGRPIQQSQQ